MARYDPFEEMDRMFDQFRTRMWDAERPLGVGSLGTELDVPARGRSDVNMDLEKSEGEYVFVADLPGFETDEIDLTFEDDTLVLAAEHEVRETETPDERDDDTGDELVVSTESRRSRRVSERVTLPADIDAEAIAATYRNGVSASVASGGSSRAERNDGVLEVHLPLLEADDEDDGTTIDIRD